MSDHEHSDGELEEVPSATVAAPSLSIGNVAGTRKLRVTIQKRIVTAAMSLKKKTIQNYQRTPQPQ